MLKSTAPQNLSLHTGVNFVTNSFHALRQHKNSKHGFTIKTANVEPDNIINKCDNLNLREELLSSKQILLYCELEKALHKVFNYSVGNLNETLVNGKFDQFFNNLNHGARVNLAFRFILKSIEAKKFGFFYAHENNTLLDRSKLVCTKDDLRKLKIVLNKTNVIESCSREIMNTKCRFYNLTTSTVPLPYTMAYL